MHLLCSMSARPNEQARNITHTSTYLVVASSPPTALVTYCALVENVTVVFGVGMEGKRSGNEGG
jgi:hypothetical protein